MARPGSDPRGQGPQHPVHRRAKQAGGWRLEQPAPGVLDLADPGRTQLHHHPDRLPGITAGSARLSLGGLCTSSCIAVGDLPGRAGNHGTQPRHRPESPTGVPLGRLRLARGPGLGTEAFRAPLLLGPGQHVALPVTADLTG